MKAFLLTISLALLAYLLFRAARVYLTVARYKEEWPRLNEATAGSKGVRLLALGDSVVQGVGASSIERTFVMLVASYIKDRTGKDVAIKNISVTGATVGDVVSHQLPQINADDFDVILLVASANDAIKNVPLNKYEESIERLFQSLPSDKVLISDVPWVRGRARYVPILHKAAKKYGFDIISHDIANQKSRWPFVYVAGDFLHPNDRGYKEIWFGNFKPRLDAGLERLNTEAT